MRSRLLRFSSRRRARRRFGRLRYAETPMTPPSSPARTSASSPRTSSVRFRPARRSRTATTHRRSRAAWAFTANAGAVITITVSSQVGDAVAYLTDPNYGILAYNDDADPTTHDARVVYQAPQSGDYRIVFEDYNHLPASFNVSLDDYAGGQPSAATAATRYVDGDTFPSDDGCNTCTCSNRQRRGAAGRKRLRVQPGHRTASTTTAVRTGAESTVTTARRVRCASPMTAVVAAKP